MIRAAGPDDRAIRLWRVGGSSLVALDRSGMRPTLVTWRSAYPIKVVGTPEPKAACPAAHSHRVLQRGGAPAAPNRYNASLPKIAQIGGVYTPPALRRRGGARQAVALHLARSSRRRRPRAYQAIGFRPSPGIAPVLLSSPATLA